MAREKQNKNIIGSHDYSLMRYLGVGTIVTDAVGKVLLLNKQAEDMLGIKEEEVLGKFFLKEVRMEEEDGSKVPNEERPIMRAIVEKREISSTELYYVTPYVKRFPVHIVSSPIFSNKELVGVITVIRNIAKEKEVDRTKSEFVSLVSHQLRTPLTAIKLFVEMLESEGLGPINTDQLEIIKSIGESNEKMIHLVDTLLNVSRMETGRLKVSYQKINLISFIENIASEAQPLAESRSCDMVFEFPKAKKAEIWTDPVLMREVLINLITNALYYSPPNEPVVISLTQKNKDKYMISVEDYGMGIPKEDQTKIFERFYRADNAIKAKTEGNGLGLYMCKIILSSLGGEIKVDSEPGMGTAFHVVLPKDGRSVVNVKKNFKLRK